MVQAHADVGSVAKTRSARLAEAAYGFELERNGDLTSWPILRTGMGGISEHQAIEAGESTAGFLGILAGSPGTGKTYTPTAKRPARYDIKAVRFGNVAKGRWLWAIEFAAPYSFDNASSILYVDADDNPKTGRRRIGQSHIVF